VLSACAHSCKTSSRPGVLLAQVSLHRGMVREYAGAPGVSAERVAEGMDIRHCALSLVRN